MVFYVAADVGGTKTRLRLWEGSQVGDNDKQIEAVVYKSQQYKSLTEILSDFLGKHPTIKVDVIAAAVCGPVVDNVAFLTNLGWTLDEREMAKTLGVKRVALINDFGGNALGVTRLTSEQVVVFQDAPATPGAPIGVIGAGTGLGEAFLTWSGKEYSPWSSEGGHTDFAPQNDLQMGLVHFVAKRVRNNQWMAKEYQEYRSSTNAYDPKETSVPRSPSGKEYVRISTERVVAGSGIPHIYDYVRTVYPHRINPQVDNEIQSVKDPAPVIQKYARGNQDFLCRTAIDLFIDMYGAEAGNLFLKTFCFGGLYIAGGVASHIQDLMKEDNKFLEAVWRKGRMSANTKKFPIYLIKDECNVGLLGAGILARRTLKELGLVAQSNPPSEGNLVKEPPISKL